MTDAETTERSEDLQDEQSGRRGVGRVTRRRRNGDDIHRLLKSAWWPRARSPATISRSCWICSTSTVTSTSTWRATARSSASTEASDLSKLVGRKGEVLDALQELTRLAVHQKTGERSRLMLDIARWRRRRRDELAALGDKVAHRVLETGEREQLSPMTPFERKIVHDAVAAVEGVRSESEGVEPSRRVVVLVD